MIDTECFSVLDYLEHINDTLSNEKLCEWNNDQRIEYERLLAILEQSNGAHSTATSAEKGRALEEISSFLLNNCGHIFEISRNIRTSTNEIDNLMRLTVSGKVLQSHGILPAYYSSFIGECKNYSSSIGVTYIGKFCSLMLTTGCTLGILFSYHGVTGRGWNNGSGLIRKFYLHKELPANRYCLVDFSIVDFRSILQGKNILQIIADKINALQFDTDYTKMISKHPAEDNL